MPHHFGKWRTTELQLCVTSRCTPCCTHVCRFSTTRRASSGAFGYCRPTRESQNPEPLFMAKIFESSVFMEAPVHRRVHQRECPHRETCGCASGPTRETFSAPVFPDFVNLFPPRSAGREESEYGRHTSSHLPPAAKSVTSRYWLVGSRTS